MLTSEHALNSILIVDDDKTILNLINTMITKHGFHVHTATDNSTALNICGQYNIDIAIIDIHLEHIDGLALAETIKVNTPATIIIIMTALPGLKTCLRTLRNQYFDYLIKPFHIDILLETIKRALALKESEKRNVDTTLDDMIKRLKNENNLLKKRIEELSRGTAESNQKYNFSESNEDAVKKSYSVHKKIVDDKS